MHSTSYADITPVSDRTSQVRDAIVAAVPNIDTAADVTETHLATITSLNLRAKSISALKSGDFSGLTGLTDLNLYGNQLSNLPNGIFEGLTALTTLRLGGNTVDPMPITVSLKKLGDNQFKAAAPTGAPFDIVIPISATNGSISDNATSITIAKGSTESNVVTVSRTADTTAAVTANIRTLPSLPQNHYGYTLSKSSALPVEIISEVVTTTPIVPEPVVPEPIEPEPSTNTAPVFTENTAPVFTDSVNTIHTIAENTAANINIGSAVPATDADDDTLTYSLSGTDASSFSIDSTSGQLSTKTTLDYETKRVYTVIVTVSDGSLTDTISVIISVIDVSDTTIVSTSLPVSQRTTQVRDAIVAAVPNVSDAADVTDTHLAVITSLNLRDAGITALNTGDFAGLTGLTSLNLYGNMLSGLPYSIFDGLTALTTLRLGGNLVDPMPLIVSLQQVAAGQFKAIISEGAPFDMTIPINSSTVTISKGSTESATFTSTTNVSIGVLPSLPANHFGYILAKSAICNRTSQVAEAIAASVPNVTGCNNVTEVDLARITSLNLSSMSITSLASDDFAELLSLTTLDLSNNQLTSLPDGIFADLTSLNQLNLSGNSVSPLPLTVSLQKVGSNQIKVVVPTGAPFDIVLQITVANGSLSDSVALTIPIGSVESSTQTITRTSGTTAAVTVDISSLPNLPSSHSGYGLVKSNQQPLEIFKRINVAPIFTEGTTATRTIAENTTAGTNIGSAVSATDANNDTLTYKLSGIDAASFSIVSTTGQLKTKAALDYETKTSYSVTITVSDGNLTDTISVTINITDIDENRAPVFSDGESTTRSVAENTGSGVNIGTAVSATDADDDTLTYTLSGTDAASFSIVSTTGQLKTKATLDYETKTSYSVTITVSDGNLTDTISVTVNVTDVDETPTNNAPVFTEGDRTSRSIAENTGLGVNIGNAVSATDADEDTLTYTLSGNPDAASFSINSTSGQLRTKSALDYETKTSYSVTISVSDGSLTDTISVTINITDVDETPAVTTKDTDKPNKYQPVFTEGDSTTRTVAENTSSGVDIGSAVSAADEDKDDTLTYRLGGTDASSFSIDSSSGQLRTSAALDYEAKTSYSVTITVSDGNLGKDTISVTINITDVDESPTNIAPTFTDGESTTRTVAENTTTNTSIGSAITATDVDNDTLTYSLSGTDASSFDIDKATGQLKTKSALDYDTKSSYTVTVTASDGTLSDSISVTITVTDVNENRAPAFANSSFSHRISNIANASVGDDIGSAVTATDADNDTLSYSVDGDDAAKFSIDSGSGQLKITRALIDGTSSSYSIKVIATDPDDATAEISVTITVTRLTTQPQQSNSAPVFDDGATTTRSIAENTDAGENIGDPVSATDADTGDTLTYTLEGTDAASFTIVSTSGQLQTSAALDFETKSSYEVTVTVTDDSGASNNSATITVRISIIDVNDAPEFDEGSTTTRSVDKGTYPSQDLGAPVSATDADDDTLIYTLSGTDAALFEIDSTNGQLSSVNFLHYEDKSSYSVTITVSDSKGGTNTITVTITDDKSPVMEILTFIRQNEPNWVLELDSGTGVVRAIIPADDRPHSRDSDVASFTRPPGVQFDNSFTVAIVFDEEVSGLEQTDLTLTENTAGANVTSWEDLMGWTGNNTVTQYRAKVEVTQSGNVTFSVAAGAATDGSGNSNVDAVSKSITVTVELTDYPPWDVNEDGSVDATDSALVTAALGQTGEAIVNARTDVNWDETVDADDVTLVTYHIEDDGGAPSLIGAFSLLDKKTLEKLDPVTLQSYLDILRTESDGSPKYLRAIAIIESVLAAIRPSKTQLLANFPNPFNPETWIPYHLANPSNVRISIYNMQGIVVRRLELGHQPTGYYTSRNRAAYWDGTNEIGEKVSSGIYFYQLQADNVSLLRKMLILK